MKNYAFSWKRSFLRCTSPAPPFLNQMKEKAILFPKIYSLLIPTKNASLPASQLSFFGDNLDILYDDKTNLFALNKMREKFLFMINCQLEIFGISFSVAEQLNWWSTLLRFEAAVILAEICLTNDGCVWQCLGALDYQLRPHLLSLYRLLMSSCLMIKCSEWVKGFNALVVVAAAGLFWRRRWGGGVAAVVDEWWWCFRILTLKLINWS